MLVCSLRVTELLQQIATTIFYRNTQGQAAYPECGSTRAVAVVVLAGGVGQVVQPANFVRQSWPLGVSNSIPVEVRAGEKHVTR